MPRRLFAVRITRGGPYDFSRDLREQDGFDEHAAFMDALVADGFILLGGPLDGGRETLHVIAAEDEDEVRRRLAADPWAANGMLAIDRIEGWTILLEP
jgi:uncharacterized protein YciI